MSASTRMAALFPGQGAQRVGMGAHLLRDSQLARAAAVQVSELLDLDLLRLMARGPEMDLAATRVAQASLFVTSVAAYDLLLLEGEQPAAVAGHSVGELVAAWAAGALSLKEAARLVSVRGDLMSQAPAGAMVAITGLPRAEVAERVAEDPRLCVALHNGPLDIVVSGAVEAVHELKERLQGLHCRASVLRTSHAFHSSHFEIAQARWLAALSEASFSPPELPMVMNIDGRVAVEAQDIRRGLGEILTAEVRWHDCMLTLYGLGVETFVECGDSQNLCRLGRAGGGAWRSFHVRATRRQLGRAS